MLATMHDRLGGAGALVAETLIHGTLLAVLAWLLSITVLRRAGASVHALLWTVVLAKFALPLAPAVPFSLDDLIAALTARPTHVDIDLAVAMNAGPVARAPVAGVPPLLVVGELAVLLAWAGAVAWLGWRRIASHRNRWRIAASMAGADAALMARVAAAAEAIGLRRLPRVVVADDAVSPHLVGVARPVLVLPGWLAGDRAVGDAAIVHELAHLRRRDPWVRLLQVSIGTVFFFFPVVWWVSRRIDDAREIACDQWALAVAGTGPRDYARALLELARRSRGAQVAGAIAMAPRPGQLGRRVDALLAAAPRRPRTSRIAALALACWAVLALGGSARAHRPLVQPHWQCTIDERLLARIMTEFPEADTDGNGELSRDEVCAHQERMIRRVVDAAVDGMSPDRVRSVAGLAGLEVDDTLDPAQLGRLKDRLAMSLDPAALSLDPTEFPGQVCVEAQTTCTEGDADMQVQPLFPRGGAVRP